MSLRYLNGVATLILLFLTVYILFVGKALILPFILALIFWYVILRLTGLYRKISINNWHPRYSIALIAAVITAGIVLYLFFLLLTESITNIMSAVPTYQQKLQSWLVYVDKFFSHKLDFDKLIAQINLNYIFSKLAVIVSTIASNFVLILVYTLFLLLEHRTFGIKLKTMCDTKAKYLKIKDLMDKIGHDINSYLKIKTAINLIAGAASALLLFMFGIKYAEFWGVLFFLSHFIPYIGPVVATVLVLLAISIQLTSLATIIILGVLLAVIQFGIGNFLEPRWMGNRLNLSPIVILLSLAFWGSIWGVLGMLLCVPLMVIINIILAKFPKTRPLAIMLSAEGRVENSST